MRQVTVVEATPVNWPEDGPAFRVVVPRIESENIDDLCKQEFAALKGLYPQLEIVDLENCLLRNTVDGLEHRWTSDNAPMIGFED